MKNILILLILISAIGCAQKKEVIPGDTAWQRKINKDFMDASKSPLKKKDLRKFKGLEFFKFDSLYVVTATLIRTPDEKPFKMKTTSDRLPEYLKYGIVEFDLKGQTFNLNIYQNLELLEDPEFVDYLFLPFLDDTNGDTSYGGGRYTETRIPVGDTLIIDFNQAYNPYCAYNDGYSCPIVPRENYLPIKVEAGVKAFRKH